MRPDPPSPVVGADIVGASPTRGPAALPRRRSLSGARSSSDPTAILLWDGAVDGVGSLARRNTGQDQPAKRTAPSPGAGRRNPQVGQWCLSNHELERHSTCPSCISSKALLISSSAMEWVIMLFDLRSSRPSTSRRISGTSVPALCPTEGRAYPDAAGGPAGKAGWESRRPRGRDADMMTARHAQPRCEHSSGVAHHPCNVAGGASNEYTPPPTGPADPLGQVHDPPARTEPSNLRGIYECVITNVARHILLAASRSRRRRDHVPPPSRRAWITFSPMPAKGRRRQRSITIRTCGGSIHRADAGGDHLAADCMQNSSTRGAITPAQALGTSAIFRASPSDWRFRASPCK